MDIQKLIAHHYTLFKGTEPLDLYQLPASGSDRCYFRIVDGHDSFIGAYNPVFEENRAFVEFTGHFRSCNLPVPEVYYYSPEEKVYFLQDLGNTNFYTWLQKKDVSSGLDPATMKMYEDILSTLVLFQVEGVKGLDLSLCYPHKSFDRQSMMWDVNYFKYMYLKLLSVPFKEMELEADFHSLIDFLLEAGQECFLYRDFQTANIMIFNDKPWFIDYQGGRLGAPQYDVASLLYDAKIPLTDDDRETLLSFYIDCFCSYTGSDKSVFKAYYSAFSLIRVMQACGAFGFRGLYEKKPTFVESVVPGGLLLQRITRTVENYLQLHELFGAIGNISKSEKFIKLKDMYLHE